MKSETAVGVGVNILIAPDSFKECMTSSVAASAIAVGVRRAIKEFIVDANVILCPVSDGGDGLLSSLSDDPNATTITTPARSVVGERPIPWRLIDAPLESSRTAIIESAAVVGLHLLPPDQRNPESLSTAGLADLIRVALDAQVSQIIIGLGGSATCDAGVGCASALGAHFFDEQDHPIPAPTGADLPRITHIDVRNMDHRLSRATLTAACDVNNPLFGPNGAARVFAPQKGATAEQVDRLDASLANLARRCAEAGLDADPDDLGAGAAGGLGFGLAAFAGAKLSPGAELFLHFSGFAGHLTTADLVITGEGRLDATSLAGKATGAVAKAARDAGVNIIALVGQLDPAAPEARHHFDRVEIITPPDLPLAQAKEQARDRLTAAATRVTREFLQNRHRLSPKSK